MKTLNKNSRQRVNLSLTQDLVEKLSFFADQREIPLASKALEYIKKGIEEDEDFYWSQLAEERHGQLEKSKEETLSFETIWKKHTKSDLPQ